MAFYERVKNGYLLRVRLQPNSSCCRILGLVQNADGDDYLKISVISVPEKGKANKELIDFLAKKIKVAKSLMTVVAGQTDRFKKITIETEQNLDDILGEINNGNNH